MKQQTTQSRQDLVILTGKTHVILLKVDGASTQPILQLRVGENTRAAALRGRLDAVLYSQKPVRLLLSVEHDTPYEQVVCPTVDALELLGRVKGIPLIWVPDVTLLASSAFLARRGATKKRKLRFLARFIRPGRV